MNSLVKNASDPLIKGHYLHTLIAYSMVGIAYFVSQYKAKFVFIFIFFVIITINFCTEKRLYLYIKIYSIYSPISLKNDLKVYRKEEDIPV